jgi:hypothetical protein
MIIRRKHTANFTTIGNALFNDERLAADEVGILAFLLSRPNEWEIRRPALMRRWKIGRDGLKRVISNWMRTGWCRAEKTRLANGTFHIIYEIRDEPGPELTEDDIRRALLLVSSEAADGESDVEVTSDQVGEIHPPPTPQPGVADHPLASRGSPIEDSINPDSVRTESNNRARGYVDLKAKWPAEHVLSDVAAQSAFLSLTDSLKEAAFQGSERYLDDCKAQNRKVCDLTTYLRERRWERFAAKEAKTALVTVKFGTPQYYRWREYKIAHGENAERIDSFAKQYGGLSVSADWPPVDMSKTG